MLIQRTNGKSIDLFKSKGLNIQFEYNANNIINPHYLNQKKMKIQIQ